MKKVVLAGNTATADLLHSYLKSDERYEVIALTVDDEYADQGGIEGLRTLPLSDVVAECSPEHHVVIMAVGYSGLNCNRQALYEKVKALGYKVETYLHPDARIYTEQLIGEGSVVLGNAVVEPHVRLGANSFVWSNTTLAHHCEVGDHCWVAAGAVLSGHAVIKDNVFVGVGATIVNNVEVGEFCIIGAGALLTKSAKASSVHLARSAEEIRFSAQDYEEYFGI